MSRINDIKREKITPTNSSPESGEVLDAYISPKGRNIDGDVALNFVTTKTEEVELDAETDKKLLRKIDLYLLPLLCLLYALQFMDKSTNSYASVMGLKKDLNMRGNQYSWTGTAFYLGYLAFEFPANMILQRFPLAKTTAAFIFAWGVILCLHATPNYAGFIALRTLLGVFESSISPAMVILTGQWYRKEEHFLRTAIWFSCNGLGIIMGGAIGYPCEKHSASYSIAGWKVLFIVTGLMTIVLSITFFLHIPDNPTKAWFLTEHEKLLVVERIRVNQQGFGNKHFKKYQLYEALTDPVTWLWSVFAIASNIPNGSLTNFSAILLANDFGYKPAHALLMNMPTGAVELVGCQLIAFSSRWIPQRLFLSFGAMVVSFMSACLLAFADGKQTRLAGYYLLYVYPITTICALSCFQSNTAGHTKKIVTTAIFFCSYCVGNLVGPQTFITSQAPQYVGGKIAIVVCDAITLVVLALIYMRYRWANVQKEKGMSSITGDEFENMEFADLTDKENPHFRYSL